MYRNINKMSQELYSSLTSNYGKQLSQKGRSPSNPLQMAYFKEVLTEAGIILSYDDKPNILTSEQSLVIRDIEKALQNHISYPSNTEEFIMGLKRLCKDHTTFKKALMATQLRKLDDISGTNVMQQESLFRIILNINCLQDAAMDVILDGLILHGNDDEEEDKMWLQLFLNALRYLPYIKNPEKLSTKLLDALEIACYPSQIEILNAVPEIVPDGLYDEIAKQLSSILEEKPDLTGAIVNCLNLLNISADTKVDIQDQILANLFSEKYFQIFPVLYEYLVTDVQAQSLPNILLKIRNVLDTIVSSVNQDNSLESNKTILINKLHSSAMSSKLIYDGWINILSTIRSHADHKPIDLLLFFMLYSINNMKRRLTETLIKKKIKLGLLRPPLLESFFSKYLTPQFLKDYLPTLIDMSSCLLQSNEQGSIEFASTMYKLTFLNVNTDCMQHQDILHNLVLLTGSSERSTNYSILKIITDLMEEDLRKLQKHSVQLMSLLEKLDIFELEDVKSVFQILCGLTCGEQADESMSGLKDEIHMLIRKLLSSAKKSSKHRGIIAAVVMAKFTATISEDQSDINIDPETSISLSDLSNSSIKEAASLLDLVTISISSCPESMGLYYDQLASALTSNTKLDKYFLAWLLDSVTNNFQNTFITETIPSPINDIELLEQYSLNEESEIEVPIYINIAGLTINSKTNIMLILAPSFRVLRLLHFLQYGGNLSTIDALLGSGVIMPAVEMIHNMDSDQVKQTADCIFHCINWFRENISAFVTQKSKQLRVKILQRLQNLIELEELLNTCMDNVPEHKLPLSYFNTLKVQTKQNTSYRSDSKNPKRARKNNYKSTEAVNESVASTSAQTQSTKSSNSAKKITRELSFREMDTDMMMLLKYPVKFQDNITQLSQRSKADLGISIKQFCFILGDVVNKLNQILQKKKVSTAYFSTNVTPTNIITDLIQFLPNINACLVNIIQMIENSAEQTDTVYDSPDLFTPHMNSLKNCLDLIMELFSVMFGWSGFQHSKNLSLLRNCLKALRQEQLSQLNSANQLIIEFTNRLHDCAGACLYLSTAVNLVKTIQALYTINMNSEINKTVLRVTSKFLKRKWYNSSGNLDSGKNYFAYIDHLMKAYLKGANIKTICRLVGTLQKQAPDLKAKSDCLPMLTSIDKSSFPILFRGLCNALQERIREEVSSLTNDEHLVLWQTTALTLQGLMTVVKVQETRTNLACFLKKSLGVLKLFLTHGVPILEIMIRSNPDKVVEIFKTMQTSTRFLHNLCCHSKLVKDTSLLAYVPHFRLTLETLVYRVKAALVANNCSDAFWMGNLKNKDLHGEEILTQQSTESMDTKEEDSDAELPEDDSDLESVLQEEVNDNTSTSASEVFP